MFSDAAVAIKNSPLKPLIRPKEVPSGRRADALRVKLHRVLQQSFGSGARFLADFHTAQHPREFLRALSFV